MFARSRDFLIALTLLLVSDVCSAATFGITVGGNSGNVFTPSALTINAGDTVVFTNAGGFHNAVINNLFRCANGCDGAGGNGNPSSTSWSFQQTFSTAGTFNYYCEQHGTPTSGMHGTLTVNAAQNTINLGGYLSGNWAVPNQGGHGFQLELTNAPGATAGTKAMVAIWFVYTPPGSTLNDGSGQNWIYAQGEFDPTSNTVTLPAILLAGARFPPNFVSTDVHRVPSDSSLWGHLTFTFSDCNNGTVSWHSDLSGYNLDNDTPLPIQRITQIDGTTCPQ
jgi:plastocyanin